MPDPAHDEIAAFFHKEEALFYPKGEIIIRMGEPPTGVYFINDGYIKIYSVTESGEENIHTIYQAGDIFPLVWAFTDKNSNTTFETLTDATLYKINKKDFLAFVTKNTYNALDMTRHVVEIMHALFEQIRNLELTNSYPRIITRFLYLAEVYGEKKGNTITFSMPITQKDLASSVNITRETANKDIHLLMEKGLIAYKNKTSLVITDIEALKKELFLYYKRK